MKANLSDIPRPEGGAVLNAYVGACLRTRSQMLQAYAAAFLEYTGYAPDEIELVERQREDGAISYRFELIDKG